MSRPGVNLARIRKRWPLMSDDAFAIFVTMEKQGYSKGGKLYCKHCQQLVVRSAKSWQHKGTSSVYCEQMKAEPE